MLAGRTAQGANPQDAKRAGQKAAPSLAARLAEARKRHRKKG
jgi:hypothetical protein